MELSVTRTPVLALLAEDDIDSLLKELNMAPAAAAGAPASGSRPGSAGVPLNQPPLLGIDSKKIRGDEELRRIFGAGVIEAVDRMEGERGLHDAVQGGGGGCVGARIYVALNTGWL